MYIVSLSLTLCIVKTLMLIIIHFVFDRLSNLKEKGRKKNHEKKQKLMENRKNLADVR